MQVDDAKAVLGLLPGAILHQEAYKKKALECHPDRLPPNKKLEADTAIKEVTVPQQQRYGGNKAWKSGSFYSAGGTLLVGDPQPGWSRRSRAYYVLVGLPFVAIIFTTFVNSCISSQEVTSDPPWKSAMDYIWRTVRACARKALDEKDKARKGTFGAEEGNGKIPGRPHSS